MPAGRPLISVVIPAYNAAAHLPAALASVRAQTFRRHEIIVVDDGSTDATPAIVAKAQSRDPRVRLIQQRNRGVGAARNTGIRAARGEFIAPLDADDLWAPRKLELQLERIEIAGPSTALAYCWSQSIDQQGRLIAWGHPTKLEGRVGSALLLANFIGNASAPLFRRSALSETGLYLTRARQNGGQGCEDWDLHLRLAERFSLCCAPAYLVSYRQGRANMSLDAASMTASYETMIRRAWERNPDIFSPLRSWSRSRFHTYLMNRCYAWGDYAHALQCLGRSLSFDPAAWLNSRSYRVGAGALLHLATGGKFRRFRSPPPLASSTRPPPLIPVAHTSLFARIERQRLEVALRETARPGHRRLRPRFTFSV